MTFKADNINQKLQKKDMTIYLNRKKTRRGLEGALTLWDNQSVKTLENPRYALKPGTYRLYKSYSPRFRRNMIAIGRPTSPYRFHGGTVNGDSRGCILTTSQGNQPGYKVARELNQVLLDALTDETLWLKII